MTPIKQEVYEVKYVRGSDRILKACYVDITSGHMGVKRTTKTKLVAKLVLMQQNNKKMTVPCRQAIDSVESYVPLGQEEVQHCVSGLTTEDKKMITSGGWLSDQIVDAGQKLLKLMYPHIQGLLVI